ncbi:hypothetical protein HBH70_077050 [Parastagonospora nodorum]|nr:hypothetical protein HBI09_164780 [Parastagonospora nodorum]KAH4173672.1 hypothetical protein HBH43_080890 [Parastagonospora nodorum]KAH4210012.1 hypothetical protein HBI95_069110 [Parastagonospora nodorum]KAH4848334.1 hypothetical protein HBH75_153400 [Parastagonospora nodorum]KAH5005623.1 hypothetical protein HBI77_114920 [Parastagonospora nodorum]
METDLQSALMNEREKWHSTSPRRPCFIPEHRVCSIVTDSAIYETLQKYGMEPYELHLVNAKVIKHGRKTFAILLMIDQGVKIRTFLEHTWSSVDMRLPFSSSEVEKVLDKFAAINFCSRQWELIAPIFFERQPHSCFDDNIILPFTSERLLDENKQGSFGSIYEVKVPRSHVKAAVTEAEADLTIIRKDISVTSFLDVGVDTQDDWTSINFRAELKMLANLQILEHPNILPLYGSYTLNGIHSFLFPQKTGNLKEILQGKIDTSIFATDRQTFKALGDLSSAIENLHHFTSDLFQVDLIGCHRDIKPDNILVDAEGLYLADFGLSVFKEATDGSSTSYNHGGGFYRSPECEIPTTRFERGKINRASDVWSFGCILADILTFLANGHQAVTRFQEKRKVVVGGCFQTHTFHDGGKDHPQVRPWLENLPINADTARAGLRTLVLKILDINPLKRPGISSVTLTLRKLSIQCQLKNISMDLEALRSSSGDVELAMECERLSLIQESVDDTQDDPMLKALRLAFEIKLSSSTVLDDISTSLGYLEAEMAHQIQKDLESRNLHLIRFYLHGAIGGLLSGTSEAIQNDLQTRLETIFLSTEDRTILEKYRDIFSDSKQYHVLSRLAAAKLMALSLSSPSLGNKGGLQCDPTAITSPRLIDNIEVAELKGACVIVESKRIEANWTDEYGKRLLQRVTGSAQELAKESISGFNTLRCVGFCCDMPKLSFKLLFAFPKHVEADATPRTLNSALTQPIVMEKGRPKKKANIKKPRLEHRFKLALSLARSISQFHKAAWLHKNINSSSVIFFPPSSQKADSKNQKENPTIDFTQPVIVGFNHSRLENENEWSEGLLGQEDLLDYQHPDYAINRKGYRLAYDYYGLGIVLLEIGLWQTLKQLTEGVDDNTPPHTLSQIVSEDLVPEIGPQMGSTYTSIVQFCLGDTENEFSEALTPEIRSRELKLKFENIVVARLQACVKALDAADCG